ncbi:TonB family protein [Limisphaera sp. 4302-co]|uniref:energy transducer TonB n=1 Tax=Limisphaera sp. 4302-co TaxID=3400417 RepID=UPI003C282289
MLQVQKSMPVKEWWPVGGVGRFDSPAARWAVKRLPETMSRWEWLQPALTTLWLFCVLVGTVGLVAPYPEPAQPVAKPVPAPVQATLLDVQLESPTMETGTPAGARTDEPVRLAAPVPRDPVPAVPAAAAMPDLPVLPDIPSDAFSEADTAGAAVPAVSAPGPAAVTGPQRGGTESSGTTDLAGGAGMPGGVQTLVWGRGEGRQPAPPYPWEARRQGQEGTVRIRFCVGANGRVLWAETLEGCPWPLLREAALHTVRRYWRFRPGEVRLYEVEIRFELARRDSTGRA